MVVLRLIGAIVLAAIISLLVRMVPTAAFAVLAHLFSDFSFKEFIVLSIISSIVTGVLSYVGPLLFVGQVQLARGNKFIAVMVILQYIYNYIGDCVFLFGDFSKGTASDAFLSLLREDAGPFYAFGAVLTLLVMLLCFVVFSVSLFINPDKD